MSFLKRLLSFFSGTQKIFGEISVFLSIYWKSVESGFHSLNCIYVHFIVSCLFPSLILRVCVCVCVFVLFSLKSFLTLFLRNILFCVRTETFDDRVMILDVVLLFLCLVEHTLTHQNVHSYRKSAGMKRWTARWPTDDTHSLLIQTVCVH